MDGRRGLVPSNFVEQVPGKPIFLRTHFMDLFIIVLFHF